MDDRLRTLRSLLTLAQLGSGLVGSLPEHAAVAPACVRLHGLLPAPGPGLLPAREPDLIPKLGVTT
eukprot:3845547-Amphidinium_carterae.1